MPNSYKGIIFTLQVANGKANILIENVN